MISKSLRLLTCLLAGYLLSSCQARQYGFFQASKASVFSTERLEKATDQVPQEPTQQEMPAAVDTLTVKTGQRSATVNIAADTTLTDGHRSMTNQLVGKADKAVNKKLMRSELKAAIRQYKAKPAESQTNGLATASFIAGLLTLLLLFTSSSIAGITLLLGPLALILGIVSLGQIRRKGQKGLGLGIAGTVLGAAYILLILLAIAAFSSWK
ncbi:MAG: DUF4190 domain-containing protein [Cytophagaceae bacterium]|nr:MAG: DUF4190 domain-containing protein [Cytophagaceae bacterium]